MSNIPLSQKSGYTSDKKYELERLKEQQKLAEELAKLKPETAREINSTIRNLKEFVLGGGIGTFKAELIGAIEESSLGIWGPILNEFQPAIAEITEAIQPLLPFIVEFITWATSVLKPVIAGIAAAVQWIVDLLSVDVGHSRSMEEIFDILWDLEQRGLISNVNYPEGYVPPGGGGGSGSTPSGGTGRTGGHRTLQDPSNSF